MTAKRRPKLGQHFLTSATHRQRIVDALDLQPDDLVIEIGPGGGAMTGLLKERAARVVAVELDPVLVKGLSEEFEASESVEVIAADILQVDVGEICRRYGIERAYVFGNLPYYITSPILHHLLESPESLRALACVVQLEVGERITAQPCSRDYGYLSVLAQFHSVPRLRFRIPPGAFSPPPAVDSALVTFEIRSHVTGWDRGRSRAFLEFVKVCFAQKRKILANNLAAKYGTGRARQALRSLGCKESTRAEELGMDDLIRLFLELD